MLLKNTSKLNINSYLLIIQVQKRCDLQYEIEKYEEEFPEVPAVVQILREDRATLHWKPQLAVVLAAYRSDFLL